MKKLIIISLMSFLLFVVAAPVYSVLIDRGGGLIYDTDRNITWLQDANMGGFNNWYVALAWADSLVFGGFEDWRLPSAVASPGGVNIITYDWTASEMGHLYYTELGNTAAYGGPAPPINPGPFTNLPNAFWSGTGANGPFAWIFNFSGGGQNGGLVSSNLLGSWAVRDGDVIPHTHCVSSSAELQDALNVAATNSTPDIIRIRSSVDPYFGNFVYTSTESYGLTIEGGYTDESCTVRVVDFANTVLDGGSNGIVLLLSTPDDPAKFIVEGITSQNGYPQPSLQVITDYGEVTLNNNNISNNPRGGVYLSKIDKVTLNNNNISNNNYGGGIHLEHINTVTLNENIINNNDRIGGVVNYGGGIFGDSAGDVSLTNNTITNNNAAYGGGVYLRGSGIVAFTNNIISDNIGEPSGGGGVYVTSAAEVNLVNNIINNNISNNAQGGGAHLAAGTAILTNNLISNNSAQYGGGAHLAAGTAILTNNMISNNSTSQGGCGVALVADTAILTNNTISNNSADNNAGSYGGGVRLAVRRDGIANIYNNIIWNNNAEVGSGADLYIDNDPDRDGFANGTVNLYNNDFDLDLSNGFFIQIDDDSVVYSDNLNNLDPKFDVDGYHLTGISPCIDAGVDAGVYDDIDGDTRPQGAGYDIGADEYVFQNTMDAILLFFDNSVTAGTLFGSGPGNSANGRLYALRSMLVEAGALINSGMIEEACGQLMAAYKKCDNDPPEFVDGEAVAKLSEMILELMEEIVCN